MGTRTLAAAALSLALMTGGTSTAVAATAITSHHAASGTLQTTLVGAGRYTGVRGTAEYERHDHGPGGHLDVHLRNARRLAGRTLVVYVHGVRAGTLVVSRAGYGHLDRDETSRCATGQRITVRGSGALVAIGHWRAAHD